MPGGIARFSRKPPAKGNDDVSTELKSMEQQMNSLDESNENTAAKFQGLGEADNDEFGGTWDDFGAPGIDDIGHSFSDFDAFDPGWNTNLDDDNDGFVGPGHADNKSDKQSPTSSAETKSIGGGISRFGIKLKALENKTVASVCVAEQTTDETLKDCVVNDDDKMCISEEDNVGIGMDISVTGVAASKAFVAEEGRQFAKPASIESDTHTNDRGLLKATEKGGLRGVERFGGCTTLNDGSCSTMIDETAVNKPAFPNILSDGSSTTRLERFNTAAKPARIGNSMEGFFTPSTKKNTHRTVSASSKITPIAVGGNMGSLLTPATKKTNIQRGDLPTLLDRENNSTHSRGEDTRQKAPPNTYAYRSDKTKEKSSLQTPHAKLAPTQDGLTTPRRDSANRFSTHGVLVTPASLREKATDFSTLTDQLDDENGDDNIIVNNNNSGNIEESTLFDQPMTPMNDTNSKDDDIEAVDKECERSGQCGKAGQTDAEDIEDKNIEFLSTMRKANDIKVTYSTGLLDMNVAVDMAHGKLLAIQADCIDTLAELEQLGRDVDNAMNL